MVPWLAGAARRALPSPDPRLDMLGWGVPTALCATVHTPLQVRVLVVYDTTHRRTLALVHHELAMASYAARATVLERFRALRPDAGLTDDDLLLGANHTHAGPGGYLHEVFYTLVTGGHHAGLAESIVATTVDAMVEAWDRRAPATFSVHRGRLPEDTPVAFNRALEAYSRNKTRQPPVCRDTSTVFVRHTDGTPLAALDFYGVHGTSVHSDQHLVHPDNKGIAALDLEATARDQWGAPSFVAFFFQGGAGDITPNSRYDRDRGLVVGHLADDPSNAAWNGGVQAEVVRDSLQQPGSTLSGPLDASLLYLDFDGMGVDANFADGRPRNTAHGLMGLSFLQGTREGPGPLLPFRGLATRLAGPQAAWRGTHGQGAKLPFCEVGRGTAGRVFGVLPLNPPPFPWLDPVVATVDRLYAANGLGDEPWVPNRQPVQVLRLGSLAIVAVSGEPSVHAGRLLVETVQASLPLVEHVVLCGYANAYSGYITTRPEYDTQGYEGGHTLYGPWTLAGWRTGIRRVCQRLRAPVHERPEDRGSPPTRATHEELARRAHPAMTSP